MGINLKLKIKELTEERNEKREILLKELEKLKPLRNEVNKLTRAISCNKFRLKNKKSQ